VDESGFDAVDGSSTVHVSAMQLAADHHLAGSINAVHLKH